MPKCRYRNCDNEVIGRSMYCCHSHKWKENQLKQYEERDMPPKYKRNKNWFYMSTGAAYNSMRGQGRRSGGLIRGAMSAMVLIEQQQVVEVNVDNLKRHFEANNGYRQNVKFCDGTIISKEEAIKLFNL